MKIFVTAKPGARAESVEKVGAADFKVSVTEPPVAGRANVAITRALADYFKVAPTRLRLVSGFASRRKVFEIIS